MVNPKTIDELIPDIQSLFDKGITLSDLALETFTSKLGINLKERFEEYTKERSPTLRMSNIGKPLRQLWFDIASGLKPEPLSADTKFKFLYGDLLEDLVILLAIEAGHEVTDLQRKVEVDGILGSIDCILDSYLVDVKSCSTFSFQKFKTGSIKKDDPFGYVGQLSGYYHGITPSPLGAAFLAIDKTLGHLCLYKLEKEIIENYNVQDRIKTVRRVLAETQPPAEYCYPDKVEDNGNISLAVGCSYCGHKFNCRKDLQGYLYANGPKWFTKIIKEPRVFKIGN